MTRSAAALKKLYEQGVNISTLLREEGGLSANTAEIIETAYDLQAGSYIAAFENTSLGEQRQKYSAELASVIKSLCRPATILEAGVGEAITFSGVVKNLDAGVRSFGFDLSWSRIAYARSHLGKNQIAGYSLCTGNLFSIPFADDSIDVVYTSHSIEPNGGNERAILQELFRVTREYLVLLEPAYELVPAEIRQRMEKHGYCRNLPEIAGQLGYKVVRHELFPFPANPANPTALLIIEKKSQAGRPDHEFACPKHLVPLEKFDGFYYSPEALVAYPIIAGIPCLRIENGVFVSRLKDFF